MQAARLMVPAKQGLIVNISSAGGLVHFATVPYCIGKSGVSQARNLTKRSWIHTRTLSVFIALTCTYLFLRSRSIYPIDRYQKTTPRVMPLHELKMFNFKSISHSWHDTGFYWTSENTLHERFITEWWCGVWIKKKMLSIQVWIQLYNFIISKKQWSNLPRLGTDLVKTSV